MTRLCSAFPTWVRGNVSPPTPAGVAQYFAERGVTYTEEYWRRLLAGEVRSARLETWQRICDATQEPFSSFFSYEPDGSPPASRPTTKRQRRRRRPADELPAPPAPREFFNR